MQWRHAGMIIIGSLLLLLLLLHHCITIASHQGLLHEMHGQLTMTAAHQIIGLVAIYEHSNVSCLGWIGNIEHGHAIVVLNRLLLVCLAHHEFSHELLLLSNFSRICS